MNDLTRSREDIWSAIEKETGAVINTSFRTTYIDVWREWFQGYRSNFHKYSEKVMGVNKSCIVRLGSGLNPWAR